LKESSLSRGLHFLNFEINNNDNRNKKNTSHQQLSFRGGCKPSDENPRCSVASSVEPIPSRHRRVPSLEALSCFISQWLNRSVMVAGPYMKNEILYYMGISSGVLTITAPLQADHKDFNSNFS
jgi:hypothetical protein